LHNRSGGNQDNLVTSYRSEDRFDLAALLGGQAQGNWTLHVADEARIDTGTLRRWGLEMELEAGDSVARGEASPGLVIPDNNPGGVSSAIAITQAGTVQGIKVSIDITHTYIGDLRVELIPPSGSPAILHDRAGGNADNLIRMFDSVSSFALAGLIGGTAEGTWQLQVKDLEAADIGKFNRWGLELTIAAAPLRAQSDGPRQGAARRNR
jgi:subtilisin-like proprotein convertase family protein